MVRTVGTFFILAAFAAGCASVPKSEARRNELVAEARDTMNTMVRDDPSIRPLLDRAVGVVVFPEIKAGGFIVGGAGGNGVVFENGMVTGFAELSQASVGAQLGGQKYAQMIIVRDRWQLDALKAGRTDLGAQASAVIIRAGAATQTQFNDQGLAVLVEPIGGAMVNASISGQKITVRPTM